MNRDEYVAKMNEWSVKMDEKVDEINKALTEEKTYGEILEMKAGLDQYVKDWNEYSNMVAIIECMKASDPMKEACLRVGYPRKRAAIRADKESGCDVCSISDAVGRIDLTKLHKCNNGGIGVDKQWELKVEALGYRMALYVSKNINASNYQQIKDCYAMKELARQIDLGKNPCSNTQILKTLTTVIQAMIGEEYKPTSHDVAFLQNSYSKHSKDFMRVTVASNRQLVGYLQEICKTCLTKGEARYGVDAKIKEK